MSGPDQPSGKPSGRPGAGRYAPDTARVAAIRAVGRVLGAGESLSAALPRELARLPAAERGLASELAFGALRMGPRYERLIAELMKRPLRQRAPEVHAALLIGMHQLFETRVPPHAAIAETVEAVRALEGEWAVGLANAVLRRVQRDGDALRERFAHDPEFAHAHPRWLLEVFKHDWPEDWGALVEAGNARAPLALRANARRTTRAAYAARLTEAGVAFEVHPCARDALLLPDGGEPTALPGFADGEVSVQDAAAQLACDLLDLGPGLSLLDACAAPGGKLAHALEREPGLARAVAVDVDAKRLERVTENLARLGLAATLVTGDAARPADWWDGQPFDRILLDAPCSATGIIRRHPDIKLLRRAKDLDAAAIAQSRLLDALWPLLAPGGRLVYATCSVVEREGARQIARFVTRTADALALPLAVPWGRVSGFGRQILPGDAGMDGFFYAALVKRA
jgi:16S rRNA (cytosine967-C5)-methyltransferase